MHRLVLVHLRVWWREIVTKTESERDAQRQLINCPPRPQGNLSEENCPLTVPLISMEAGCHLTQHGETSWADTQGRHTRSHVICHAAKTQRWCVTVPACYLPFQIKAFWGFFSLFFCLKSAVIAFEICDSASSSDQGPPWPDAIYWK